MHPKTGYEVKANWTGSEISLHSNSRIGIALSERSLNEKRVMTVDLILVVILSTKIAACRGTIITILSRFILLFWGQSRGTTMKISRRAEQHSSRD